VISLILQPLKKTKSLSADNLTHDSQNIGGRARVLSIDSEDTGARVPGLTVRLILLRRGAGSTDAESENTDSTATLNRLLVVLVKNRLGVTAEADLHADTLSDEHLRGADLLEHGGRFGTELGHKALDIDVPIVELDN
jgi:hypothetical protein